VKSPCTIKNDKGDKTMPSSDYLDELNKEKGKYIICRCDYINPTRLFICRFNFSQTIEKNDGRWDMFTISKSECFSGYYICSIDHFKIDNNGYPNLVAAPLLYIGDSLHKNETVWKFLFKSGRFSGVYYEHVEFIYTCRYNEINVYQKYNDALKSQFTYDNIYSFILHEVISDNITMNEISCLLQMPTYIEKVSEHLFEDPEFSSKYPLLNKKIPKDSYTGCCSTELTTEYLERKTIEYDKLNLGNESELLKRVETVLAYWDKLHKEEKSKKKGLRKLGKQK
jgi:hypothetical protein